MAPWSRWVASARRRERAWGGLPLLPAYYLLGFFLDSFAEAEADLGRARELAADRVAVEATDGVTTAAALAKVHGFHRCWRRALAVLRERIASGESDLNASADFAAAAEERRESARLRQDLDDAPPPHPTDTHPSLRVRLRALGLSLGDVPDAIFAARPAAPGSALVDAPEALERALTAVERARLIEARYVIEGSRAAASGRPR